MTDPANPIEIGFYRAASPPADTWSSYRVLEFIARDRSNAQTAAALAIEESTVTTHGNRILLKLGVGHRVQAVIACERGLVAPGSRAQR